MQAPTRFSACLSIQYVMPLLYALDLVGMFPVVLPRWGFDVYAGGGDEE
jgi:hypothetical protein